MRSGLFKLHDERGVPLSISLMLLAERGEQGNVAEFFFDALLAGWTPEGALAVIEGARRDNDLPFDSTTFMANAAAVWTRCGSLQACREACRSGNAAGDLFT